ncbi:MAG: hypothetical protein K8I27_08845 [Planctomycetes bacterium]|nr:hypothetical protein [Planctomycetota bacterium]
MKYLTPLAVLVSLFGLSFQTQIAQESGRASSDAPAIAANILRQPALSPDGATLAFVYDGDIWSVATKGGVARRLTVTEDNEGDPQFSPDGKWLAFRSVRYGNDDLFVMPGDGGKARRLTFADSQDTPECWLPDSSGVIFSSYRRENSRDLWVVRMEGGEPWPITGGGLGVHEYDASISPDGKRLVYCNSGGNPARRRGYHGHADGDIWICDFDGVQTNNHKRLTENESHDAYPVFMDNKRIAYVTFAGDKGSNRIGDLAFVGVDGKALPRAGEQRELDPRELAVGGMNMAFTSGNYGGWNLHVWEMGNRHPFRVTTPEISLNTDVRRADVRVNNLTSAEEFALSPDGKKIAFVAGGDVFVMPADADAVPLQVTDTVEEECSIVWAHNNTELYFLERMLGVLRGADFSGLADGSGWKNIHLQNGHGPLSNLHMDSLGRLWGVENEETIEVVYNDPSWEGKRPDVMTAEIKGNFHGWTLGEGNFSVSSDGQWVLYEQPNPNYDDHVLLANALTGETHPISHLFGSAAYPRFSGDGKRVVFVNNQEGDYDVWQIELTREDQEFKEDKLGKLFKKKEPRPEGGGDDKKKEGETGDEEPKPGVLIHLDGIKDRIKRLTTLDGHEFYPVALKDGKTTIFIGNSQGQANIWKLTNDPDKGPDLKQLTQSKTGKSQLTISADEKTLWWLDGGKITSMAIGGGKTETYNFRVEQRRLRTELREAAFDEAVWVMDNYYYDREHHGINWNATAKRYRSALASVSTGDEYDAVMDELLGELNSSHQGYYGVDERTDRFSESTGCMGLLFDPVALSKGEWIIKEVVKGGPCDVPESGPGAGNLLKAVNGTLLQQGVNLSQLLVSTTGKRTVLTCFNGDGEWDVAVKPISRGTEYGLFYTRWVEYQRALVDKHSDGRLGYVHIQAMNDGSLREFKHELGDEMLGKDGVVIDVRYNGGGNTAVDVLEILIKRPWLLRQWGGLERVSENIYRSVALEKPSILLINQASFSNAEIMAEGFRKLEIGKIVGVDTAGGVIGTGSYGLIDGSRMRLPSSGAYTTEGENLELVGRKPDFFVENHPEELDKGIDRQTEAAVKELLKQID